MSIYQYKGVNKLGKSVSGNIDADNQRAAKLKLKQKGIYVTVLKDKGDYEASSKNKSLNITIGKNSIIGGNAWLTESVGTGTKVTIPAPDLKIKSKRQNCWSSGIHCK